MTEREALEEYTDAMLQMHFLRDEIDAWMRGERQAGRVAYEVEAKAARRCIRARKLLVRLYGPDPLWEA